MDHLIQLNNFDTYKDQNRHDIDESLVSLKFLKEIDDFLEYKNLSNRDLAKELRFSESYISQLMTGVKKINMSFLNKFEKKFNVEFDVRITENVNHNFKRFDYNNYYEININIDINVCAQDSFNKRFFSNDYIEIKNVITN